MATVRDILTRKGPTVWTIHPEATVLDAAMLMNQHKVGSLVVLGDSQRIVGMFTERDVLVRVVAAQRDPAATRVAEVMTEEVACCLPETSIEEARGAMKNRRVRHLPVVDNDNRLLGMISIGDLNAFEAVAQEQTIHLLHEYLYGRA
ncbi:MAG TPA: CBS domain-containing protein [Gemmataceae bacterium]|nr:CBS domain-containing protein [Gemmataceae bacterium]